MAKELRIRRGTTAQHSTFTGAPNEVTADTTKKTLVLHDGTTVGGVPMARENLANVPAGSVATAMIADGAITSAKIADGAVVTVDLADGAVTAAKMAAGAAAGNLGFTPANSTSTVNLTGDQTIGGVKTFTSGVRFNDGTTQTTAAGGVPAFGAVGTIAMLVNSVTGSAATGTTYSGANLFYLSAIPAISGSSQPANSFDVVGDRRNASSSFSTQVSNFGTQNSATFTNLSGTWRLISPVKYQTFLDSYSGRTFMMINLYVRIA